MRFKDGYGFKTPDLKRVPDYIFCSEFGSGFGELNRTPLRQKIQRSTLSAPLSPRSYTTQWLMEEEDTNYWCVANVTPYYDGVLRVF